MKSYIAHVSSRRLFRVLYIESNLVILRTHNKITDFFMILAWASPFNTSDPGPAGDTYI